MTVFHYEPLANSQWRITLTTEDYSSETILSSRRKCLDKIRRYIELNRIRKAEITIESKE